MDLQVYQGELDKSWLVIDLSFLSHYLFMEKREQVIIFYLCCYFNWFFLVFFLCVPLLCFRTMVTTAFIPILVLCLAQNVQVILGAPLKKCLEDGKILTLPDSTCQSIAVECGVRYFLIKFFYIWYKYLVVLILWKSQLYLKLPHSLSRQPLCALPDLNVSL